MLEQKPKARDGETFSRHSMPRIIVAESTKQHGHRSSLRFPLSQRVLPATSALRNCHRQAADGLQLLALQLKSSKMDAADDDQDVKLQRASADLLEDFKSSIGPILWKTTKSGKRQIRSHVRSRDTSRLVNLVRYAFFCRA